MPTKLTPKMKKSITLAKGDLNQLVRERAIETAQHQFQRLHCDCRRGWLEAHGIDDYDYGVVMLAVRRAEKDIEREREEQGLMDRLFHLQRLRYRHTSHINKVLRARDVYERHAKAALADAKAAVKRAYIGLDHLVIMAGLEFAARVNRQGQSSQLRYIHCSDSWRVMRRASARRRGASAAA